MLVDFYRANDGSRFFLEEAESFLRIAGVLDDTNLKIGPQLIVANYVQASSNCMFSTPVFGLCCSNECEDIMSRLEGVIAAPTASSAEIVTLAMQISTTTVQGPRNLSRRL